MQIEICHSTRELGAPCCAVSAPWATNVVGSVGEESRIRSDAVGFISRYRAARSGS